MHKLAYILIMLLCLGACAPGHNDYSQFHNIPNEGWCYNDTLIFSPKPTDSTATGLMTLALRHSNDYIYSNIWVEVGYNTTNGHQKIDTLNILLADIYGRWYGKGLGASFQIQDTISPDMQIAKDSPITVRHIMRTDTLLGIEQVGLIFTSNDDK